MLKDALRKRLLQKLRRQPQKERLAKSTAIARRLARLPLYRRAKSLMCYAAFDGEVETRMILEQALKDRKRVAVPVVLKNRKKLIAVEIKNPGKDLERRTFGIQEPALRSENRIDPEKLDLIFVPGVAFTKKGERLGRGGGYFDRFLESLPVRIPRVGLAFRFQLVKRLPIESHDQPVNQVITDKA